MENNNRNLNLNTITWITGGKLSGNAHYDTWKYWEIVGELISRGADRFVAQDTMKWIQRASVGETKAIDPNITIKIKKGSM